MNLYRRSGWFNPFFIDVNNKSYELKNIHFFNPNGIICSTSRGWFGNGDNTTQGLSFDIICNLKRKVDFTSKSAFIISRGNDYGLSAELYIPADAIGLSEPSIRAKTERYFIVRWNTSIKAVYCEAWHFIDENLSRVEHQISAVGEKITNLYGNAYEDLPRCIEVLQKLYNEREEELQRLSKITDEEILKFYSQKV